MQNRIRIYLFPCLIFFFLVCKDRIGHCSQRRNMAFCCGRETAWPWQCTLELYRPLKGWFLYGFGCCHWGTFLGCFYYFVLVLELEPRVPCQARTAAHPQPFLWENFSCSTYPEPEGGRISLWGARWASQHTPVLSLPDQLCACVHIEGGLKCLAPWELKRQKINWHHPEGSPRNIERSRDLELQ